VAKPVIKSITVRGYTEWHAYEHKDVPAFRGTRSVKVKCRDASGKWAKEARRYVRIIVRCTDGIIYTSDIRAERILSYEGNYGCRLWPVAHFHGIETRLDSLPPVIEAAVRKTVRRLVACARYLEGEYRALPTHKPIKGAK